MDEIRLIKELKAEEKELKAEEAENSQQDFTKKEYARFTYFCLTVIHTMLCFVNWGIFMIHMGRVESLFFDIVWGLFLTIAFSLKNYTIATNVDKNHVLNYTSLILEAGLVTYWIIHIVQTYF